MESSCMSPRRQILCFLQWWIFCVLCSAPISVAANDIAAFHGLYSFSVDEPPLMGITRIGRGKYETSKMTCALNCLHDYTRCSSFLFNSETGLCTLGASYNLEAPLPTPQEGQLYVIINYCNILNGFRLITYRGTTTCIGNFEAGLTYDEADKSCQKKGGFLASVKIQEKLDILLKLLGPAGTRKDTWVGCDDKVEEGTYVWKEDGESFTINTAPLTFLTADDGKNDTIEDCICLPSYAIQLHDYECSNYWMNYACEIALQ